MDNPSNLQKKRPWMRAVFGIFGIFVLSLYVIWDADNEKKIALTQAKKTEDLQKRGNLSPYQTGIYKELITHIRKLQKFRDDN